MESKKLAIIFSVILVICIIIIIIEAVYLSKNKTTEIINTEIKKEETNNEEIKNEERAYISDVITENGRFTLHPNCLVDLDLRIVVPEGLPIVLTHFSTSSKLISFALMTRAEDFTNIQASSTTIILKIQYSFEQKMYLIYIIKLESGEGYPIESGMRYYVFSNVIGMDTELTPEISFYTTTKKST